MPQPSTRKDPIAYVVESVVGGLDTKRPPTKLDPSASPELLNIVLSQDSIQRRGGFTPAIKQNVRMNSLQNRGVHGGTREVEGGNSNTDILIVPGVGIAGHRPIYNAYGTLGEGLTVDFFFSPGDLTSEHVGNANSGAVPFGASPYTVMLRPILSKGPAKWTLEPGAESGLGSGGVGPDWPSGWSEVQDDAYGEDPTATRRFGMPWCLYISNDNASASAPDWKLKLAVHVWDSVALIYRLHILALDLPILVEANYHVVFALSNTRVYLRAARIIEEEVPVYATDTIALGANEELVESDSPILVFDCPGAFVEEGRASGTGSPGDAGTHNGTLTQRPGLNLGGATDGGYFFASKRFEGRVEDIAVWKSDQLALLGDVTARDRTTKLIPEDHADQLVNMWPMTRCGDDLVQEVTGRGNHIYLAPNGPSFAGGANGIEEQSWVFNGLTSFAFANLEANPNWRFLEGANAGAFDDAMRKNRPHGIEATVWIEAIEPNFQSVIAEIPNCLRLALNRDGTVIGYARNTTGTGYDKPNAVTSTTRLIPGCRYQIILFRYSSGTALELVINGQQDGTSALTADDGLNTNKIGGLQIGMGSVDLDPVNNGTEEQLNFDSRSGFFGRIESARVLLGERNLVPLYKDETSGDWRYDQIKLFDALAATANRASAADNSVVLSLLASAASGFALSINGHQRNGSNVRYLISDGTNDTYYLTFQNRLSAANGGHDGDMEWITAYVWWCLDRWVFNAKDEGSNTAGAHLVPVEYRTVGPSPNNYKYIHLQESEVVGQQNVLGGITRGSIEIDYLTENWTNQAARDYQHVGKPYMYRAPLELRPRFTEGIAIPADEQNPITLLHDWYHEESGERFLLAAAGRQVYWARDVWRGGSPFIGETNARSVWLHGGLGDHLLLVSEDNANQALNKPAGVFNTVDVEMWVHPFRLDGQRLLAHRRSYENGSGQMQINYAIWSDDGVINVAGSQDGATRSWRYRCRTPGTDVPHVGLQLSTWNHVHVTIGKQFSGADGVCVHINGILMPIESVYDSFSGGTPDTESDNLYLGGMPTGTQYLPFTHVTPGGTDVIEVESWVGMITEFRQTALPNSLLPDSSDGFVPKERHVDSASTYYLLHLNEGEGWGFTNAAALTPLSGGHSRMQEMVLIGDNLCESSDAPYRSVTFRDRVYLTNGMSFPQEVKFTGLTDAEGPFRMYRMGMQQPWAIGTTLVAGGAGSALGGAGDYNVYMSFLDVDGRESEAALLGTISVTTEDYVTIHNCPRSTDPQVVGRRFYIGVGIPVFHSDVDDNLSLEVQLYGAGSGLGVVVGERLPAPKAKLIAVAGFQVVMANSPDIPAGGSYYAWSKGQEPIYFPALNQAIVDSSNGGDPLVSAFGHLGYLFLSKRNSVWRAQIEATGALPVNQSVGVGGGVSIYDNIAFGGSPRGINAFDGANISYRSDDLERDFQRDLDRSDEALLRMFSVYHEPDSQLWFSVRAKGEEYNSRAYVLHTGVGQRQSWTRCDPPKHSYLASRVRGDEQQLIIGTVWGQILRYNRDIDIDGHDGGNRNSGVSILAAQSNATPGPSTSVTSLSIVAVYPAAGFDTSGEGYRGMKVYLSWTESGVAKTAERWILRNTIDTIWWSEPVEIAVGVQVDMTIGHYDAYWTSGWIEPQRFGSGVLLRHIDIDTDPVAGSIDVMSLLASQSRPTARAFDDASAQSKSVPMTAGWVSTPAVGGDERRGRYFRMKFRRAGIRVPFSVHRWGVRFDESGQRGLRS